MGLAIHGETTDKTWYGSYSTLHYTVRKLALLYCGMPDKLGREVDSMGFYMMPYIKDKQIDLEIMRAFLWAIQQAGYFFPNILFHSDCEGKYSKRGKVFKYGLYSGNSKGLLEELERLCSDKDLEKYQREMEATMRLKDLIKDEVENGKGIIYFG